MKPHLRHKTSQLRHRSKESQCEGSVMCTVGYRSRTEDSTSALFLQDKLGKTATRCLFFNRGTRERWVKFDPSSILAGNWIPPPPNFFSSKGSLMKMVFDLLLHEKKI